MKPYILPLSDSHADLETVGGKGMSLSRLVNLGIPVPDGFHVTTEAYRQFVAANTLQPKILTALNGADISQPDTLETASAKIGTFFVAAKIPSEVEAAIRHAYSKLDHRKSVAVRSSATAEDLPDASFAGQQETYLNIQGTDSVLEAVKKCWASLWTARAIGYRIRNGIPHDEAALAVIVQEMVPSDTSGVLFTANPLTGVRSESVIDATLGLGEALVSGLVEPDHYIVDTRQNRILAKSLGAKKVSTRSKPAGGVELSEEGAAAAQQALSDEQILHLAQTGQRIQNEYHAPQDIEWAFAQDRLYILQSRPITSLFPVPEVSFDPLIVWFSFAAAQGLVGPMTPLGIDIVLHVVSGASGLFGAQRKQEELKVFATAGERIWIRISDLIRNPVGSRVLRGALGIVEPGAGKVLEALMADPRLGASKGQLRLDTVRRVGKFGFPVLIRLARNTMQPQDARARFDALIESYLAAAQIAPADDRFERLLNVVAGVGIAFILFDPEQLFDASFQLSFLAVGSIGALAVPLLDGLVVVLGRVRRRRPLTVRIRSSTGESLPSAGGRSLTSRSECIVPLTDCASIQRARPARAATLTSPETALTRTADPADWRSMSPDTALRFAASSVLPMRMSPETVLTVVGPAIERTSTPHAPWQIVPADRKFMRDFVVAGAIVKALEVTPRLRLELVPRAVISAEELEKILKEIRPGDALLAPDIATMDIPATMLEVSLTSRIPAVFSAELWVTHGGLVSYGADYRAQQPAEPHRVRVVRDVGRHAQHPTDEGAEDAEDRAGRADGEGVRRPERVGGDAREEPGDEVDREHPPTSERPLDLLDEQPERPSVEEQMEQSCMQEHRREQPPELARGDGDRTGPDRNVLRTTRIADARYGSVDRVGYPDPVGCRRQGDCGRPRA